jgi:WD40 repeat protein
LVNQRDFKDSEFQFTHSTFVPEMGQALSGTVDGDVVVWANKSLGNLSTNMGKGCYATIKLLRLHNSAINCITTAAKKYILTGGEDGFVKVYDNQLRLLLWFEKLRAGPIMSITFSNTKTSPHLTSLGADAVEKNEHKEGISKMYRLIISAAVVSGLDIPEFVVSTRSGKILQLHKNLATGSAAAVAGIVSRAIENEKMGNPAVKEDYSFDSGSSMHDGAVTRSSVDNHEVFISIYLTP